MCHGEKVNVKQIIYRNDFDKESPASVKKNMFPPIKHGGEKMND